MTDDIVLTDDEKHHILTRRKTQEMAQKKKEAEKLETKSTKDMTREELIKRVRYMELKEYIRRALARRIKHNSSGDWDWHREDEPYIRSVYAEIGEECPVSDW